MKTSVAFLSFLFFLSCLMASPLYAGTQTLTTYYPAPQGNYKNMEVNNNMTFEQVPVGSPPCSANGTSVNLINESPGVLQVCDNSAGTPKTGNITATSLWVYSGVATNYLYPVSSTANVSIGTSAAPAYTLSVAGTANTTGDLNVGGNAIVTGNANITGNATVTGNASVTGTGVISGNTTLGAAAANTTVITGTTTINGNTTVVPAAGGSLYVNQQTAGTGNLTGSTVPGIMVCDSGGGNCGYLAVAKSGNDGNYYAVYGP